MAVVGEPDDVDPALGEEVAQALGEEGVAIDDQYAHGVIIHGADGEIRGLTTAASMWAVTGVGIAVGAGHALFGVLLALLIYLIAAWGQWPALTQLRKQRSSGRGTEEGGGPEPP